MENSEKKKYVKPKVTQIKLDAKCAVLGGCKTSGEPGPVQSGCWNSGIPVLAPCNTQAS